MSDPRDRLYDLLPGIIRLRDAEVGGPLHGLLGPIGEEVQRAEAAIRRLYDNAFIETCEPWAIPYIGDLVGYQHPRAPRSTPHAPATPRRDVADTLRLRRRKGTLAVLEEIAAAVAGWPAQAVEDPNAARVALRLWRLRAYSLTRARPAYLPRRTNCFTVSPLGNDAPLFIPALAEDEPAALAEPEQIPQPLTRQMLRDDLDTYYGEGRALCLYENGHPIAAGRLAVANLAAWAPEVFGEQVAVDPERGRFMLPEAARQRTLTASSHYGFAADLGGGEYRRPAPGGTLERSLFRPGHLIGGGGPLLDRLATNEPFAAFLRGLLDPALLERSLANPADRAALDPPLLAELNRIIRAFPLGDGPLDDLTLDDDTLQLLAENPAGPRRVRLNRLLLEAAFPEAVARGYALVRVTAANERQAIGDAIRDWQGSAHPPRHLVVELADSGLYVEPVVATVGDGQTLELRAADGCRPTILLPERGADIDDLVLTCGADSRVILDGLQIARRAVRIVGQPAEVVLRHCTLVPGWEIDADCESAHGDEPSLILSGIPLDGGDPAVAEDGAPLTPAPPPTRVRIERSILGSILVQRDEVALDPVEIAIADSVLDATGPERAAVLAPNGRLAHAVLHVARCTVIGAVLTHAIELGEDAIFAGEIRVARRQLGCLRFCSVRLGSRTPRRYACQPDLAAAAADDATREAEVTRVGPRFMTLRYGKPDYCRLADDCAPEITAGAADESELGVYHDLVQPQRAANLRQRLDEFTPLGWQIETTYGS